ncbi:MAG: class I SAM-dependent methyltransferase [Opitutae bacterium]|nr:class I SAM-dependent methyltransferase [Opitutae bacterium]
MACLRALLKRLPPAGDFYDIGGGNGFVAAGLDAAGYPSVLVEPGSGAINAARRGVRRIVQATLQDAAFRPHALAAAGALDVIEHVEHDVKFLRLVRERLRPGGRFYCTVPAAPALWSHEDERAGHFRRYRADTLSGALRRASFEVEFVSPFFTWLVAPVFFCRALPSRLHRGTVSTTDWSAGAPARDHSPPAALAPFVARVHAWELRRLQSGRALPFGTSLIAVARAF